MNYLEYEIYALFERYATQLNDRKWELLTDITNWRDTQNRLIEEHASKQRSLLDQEYQKQVTYMGDLRQQYMAAVRPQKQARNDEQINQLLSQCKALKIELADFGYSDRSIPFIEFMNEEQRARRKQNERKTERTEDSKSRSNVGGGYDYYNTNSKDAHRISPSKLMSGHMEHINQPSNTIKSANRNAPSPNSNDSRYSNASSGNISMDECPVCSMFFPSHMKRLEQATHVNAHFQEA